MTFLQWVLSGLAGAVFTFLFLFFYNVLFRLGTLVRENTALQNDKAALQQLLRKTEQDRDNIQKRAFVVHLSDQAAMNMAAIISNNLEAINESKNGRPV